MDALTLPRLQAQIATQGVLRQLRQQAQRGGEEGRIARERLAQGEVRRPDGPLVWLHAPAGLQPGVTPSLSEKLAADAPDLTILLTSADPVTGADAEAVGALWQQPPVDAPVIVQRFVDHWRPQAGVWFGTVEQPLLADAAARAGMPLFLQDAIAPDIPSPRARVLQRRLMGLFERILAVDATEADRIRAIGSISTRIETTGHLSPIAEPPPGIDSERDSLAQSLGTRPVWLAVDPAEEELEAILRAHLEAKRTTHRLLLIIVPRDAMPADSLTRRLQERGWMVARRDAGDDPVEATDIFVMDVPEERGIAYRLAPVCFLGGTLADGAVPNAMDPATLGSAIITGPRFGAQSGRLERLCHGGACRRIWRPGELAAAVVELLSPEQAAFLALNAWDIASDGAQVRDRLARLLLSEIKDGRAG